MACLDVPLIHNPYDEHRHTHKVDPAIQRACAEKYRRREPLLPPLSIRYHPEGYRGQHTYRRTDAEDGEKGSVEDGTRT